MSRLISLAGLSKSFFTPAGELRILKGIDAVFDEAEMVSIVGASGAGKSTFLHILGTLDRPTSGRITYMADGREQDPFAMSATELAYFRNSFMGFVFQFHYLLPEFSALENVMMPGLISLGGRAFASPSEVQRTAEALLEELGLGARKEHKPGELSGGEQQRVAVARALLTSPKVVLADEPTGNLDTATGEELFRVLSEINERRGVTFIIVTHNERLSSRCHRTLVMSDGVLTERDIRER